MNEIKERALCLIKNAFNAYNSMDDAKTSLQEFITDFVLANGVIVPPCKVGDTVYFIPKYNGKPYCGVCVDKVQMIGITSRGVHIKARNHHDHNKMYMLGKTVFLTKEEAEKALKERNNGTT